MKTTKTKTRTKNKPADTRSIIIARVQADHAHYSSDEIRRTMNHRGQLVAIAMAQKDRAVRAIASAQDDVIAADMMIDSLETEVAALSLLIQARGES